MNVKQQISEVIDGYNSYVRDVVLEREGDWLRGVRRQYRKPQIEKMIKNGAKLVPVKKPNLTSRELT